MQEGTGGARSGRKGWVDGSIGPASHTNAILGLGDDKPSRASRRGAEWCLKGVDQCWSQKERFLAEEEMEEAKEAYAHAREVYRRRLAESQAE
jgi:hypothetical protein